MKRFGRSYKYKSEPTRPRVTIIKDEIEDIDALPSISQFVDSLIDSSPELMTVRPDQQLETQMPVERGMVFRPLPSQCSTVSGSERSSVVSMASNTSDKAILEEAFCIDSADEEGYLKKETELGSTSDIEAETVKFQGLPLPRNVQTNEKEFICTTKKKRVLQDVTSSRQNIPLPDVDTKKAAFASKRRKGKN